MFAIYKLFPGRFRVLGLIFGLGLIFYLVSYFVTERLWFRELNYLSVFTKRFQTELILWVVVGTISLLFLLRNIAIAYNNNHQPTTNNKQPTTNNKQPTTNNKQQTTNNKQQTTIPLKILLPTVMGLFVTVGLIFLHCLEIALEIWPRFFSKTTIIPTLPSSLDLAFAKATLTGIFQNQADNLWHLGVMVGVAVLLSINLKFGLKVIAWTVSLIFGLVMSNNWLRILPCFQPTNFGITDPIFHKDISFYVFNFPFWQLLNFWWGELLLLALISVLTIYLLSGNSISEGKFSGFSPAQLRHLFVLGGLAMGVLARRHWLWRYQLLYSTTGVTYGASYTDVKVELPAETILALIAGAIALLLFFTVLFNGKKKKQKANILLLPLIYSYVIIILLNHSLIFAVQRLGVQPNEFAREKPYIERSIAYTKSAFALDKIEEKTFNPEGNLTALLLENNFLTIDNIRLWDTLPLLQANRQLQQIRSYYEFADADIDRYTLQVERENRPTRTEKQQVIIAARELDYNSLPEEAQTWVNKHLVYTHGYGFTLSPVNRVGEGGLPYYFVKDIGSGQEDRESGELYTSSQAIANSIPIGNPRIYYGELTNNYVLTDPQVKELDFPAEDGNAYNTYDGTGGIFMGGLKRLLFATYLHDWRMLFADNLSKNTRLLWRRNINLRLQAIAPFLRFDRDPYLVVADTDSGEENYLHWIIDAYTTSASYPYSDPGDNEFNYIRNSVKVVVDAYNGKVNFYVAEPEDPIIRTWSKIFPELFQPLENMPKTLRSHIRYPEDLFSIQSKQLLIYHMSDPQVFYNREDQWQIPQEIYRNQLQPLKPYYLIMRLPVEPTEEFIILLPYTPIGRPNLIGWLAGRSDGKQYGKLLLYRFPKQKLVYGPDQIEALINQDPVISQQISLWDRQGSKVVQGNLLIIPIEESLLYVEPLYLEAVKNSVPILARVVIVYQNQIVMAETLAEAMEVIFKPETNSTSTIIRSLDELLDSFPPLPLE